jgi:aryl-alcohol dehydrogenase-like predicted oxidoreductase
MHRRLLIGTDREISAVGFGGWQIGGSVGRLGWKSQDDATSIAALHRALDVGINWIDTAPVYGFGHSEELIGRALLGVGDRPVVITKCGLVWDENGNQSSNLTADSIRRECINSLRRLRAERLDVYLVHWPIPDSDLEDAWGTLAELKREGLVGEIGASNFTVDQMRRVERIAPITVSQAPYSILDRRIEAEHLPYCRERGIGVVVYSPLASGLLSGSVTYERLHSDRTDWRHHDPLYQEPHFAEHLAVVERLAALASRLGRTVAELAVAWTLRSDVVCGSIVGFRRGEQVDVMAGAADLVLDGAACDEIEGYLATICMSPPPEPRLVPPSQP